MESDARSDGPGPETGAGQDESIQKLRIANQALRQQLKEFSRALDASLAQNQDLSDATTKASSSAARRRDMVAALSAKEKQLKAVHKKLEIYKRANVELKKQLGSSYHPEKLAQLKNEKREKERIIEQLQQENKTLLQVQRNQSKRIEEQEHMRSEWPTRVSSLMADLRVAKDKLRKAKEREQRVEHDSKKLHEQMVRLQTKNKNLQAQLSAYERKGGQLPSDKAKRKLVAEWKAEKAKLQHSIEVLERSKQQERTKGERLLRANMAELQKVKKEMERHKQQLDEKEKEIRLQVLQVKKLRRQLRELALGGGGSNAKSGWEDSTRSAGLGRDGLGSKSAHSLLDRRPPAAFPNTTGDEAGARGGRRGGSGSGDGGGGGRPLESGGGSSRDVRARGGKRRGKRGGKRSPSSKKPKPTPSQPSPSRARQKLAEAKRQAAEEAEQREAAAKAQEEAEEEAARHGAATKVQRMYRQHSSDRLAVKQDKAATKLQSTYRGHRVRKETRKPKRASKRRMNEDEAAVKIQRTARRKAARKRESGGRGGLKRQPSQQQLEDGAVAVQSVYRGFKGRQRFNAEKNRKEDAVITIQALGRGRLGRMKARRARGERQRQRARRFASGRKLRVGNMM